MQPPFLIMNDFHVWLQRSKIDRVCVCVCISIILRNRCYPRAVPTPNTNYVYISSSSSRPSYGVFTIKDRSIVPYASDP